MSAAVGQEGVDEGVVGPGAVPEVFQTIVDGIVEAILEADRKLRPATIRVAGGDFPLDRDVAFKRSLAACQRNPDATKADANAAIDRRMLLFRFDALDGSPIAIWNFFGVHATSVSSDNHRITSDNKGYAASLMEEQGGGIAVFAQRKAGDVTPNHVYDKGVEIWRMGAHDIEPRLESVGAEFRSQADRK